jgi:transcriptional regulator of heat shock response
MRTIDHEVRRREVLAAVIDAYVKNASPVSSETLVRDFKMDLSPATVRNVLAELEELGYLTHPHTSAGRIPTQSGYRYFVNNLMGEIGLIEAEKYRIESDYHRNIGELEQILDETSRLISEMTHYAGIVSFSDWQHRIFYKGTSFMLEQPEFRDLSKIRHLLAVLEEKEQLLGIINRDLKERIAIYIGSEIACSEIDDCSLIVSSYKVKDRPSGRLAVLGPIRMQYGKTVSTLEYLSEQLSAMLKDW